MEYLKLISDPGWWKNLTGSEFGNGFVAGLALALLLLLVLLVLRGIILFIFRTRRCSYIEVERGDGNTMVNREVIASVVDRELAAYPSILAEKIVLTRRGRNYQLTVHCTYLLSDTAGIPAFCDEFKPKLLGALAKGFGIDSLQEIRLWICNHDDNWEDSGKNRPQTQEKDAYIGL